MKYAFSLMTFLLLLSCSRQPLPQREKQPLNDDIEIVSSTPGQYGGRFIDASPGEPNTFNPLVVEDATSGGMIGLISAGLTSYNPIREEVVPALAKSWDMDSDNRTFVFHLREGLCFSDGHPLTADDVVFTFECYYDKRFPTRKSYDLSVNGKPFKVEKINDLTIRITTPEIYAPFLQVIGWAEILPKHILEPYAKDGTLLKQWTISTAQKNPQSIVGSGMFRIHSYHPGERIVFEPNPYYYRADKKAQRLPYINFLITKFVKDSNASVIAFATGLTDSEGISPDHVAWVSKSASTYHFDVYDRGPSTSSSFIWFNQNPGKNKDGKLFIPPHKLKWFRNRLFRQAVSYAIDREGIVKGVLFGRGAPLWGPESPANKKWFNPDVQQYPYDPRKSLELLTQAGFTLGEDDLLRDSDNNLVEFTLITNAENQIRQNMATVFMENMKKIGITVHLQFLDFSTFVGKIQDSYDYESGLLGFTGGGDPVGGMSVFVSKGRLHQWHPNQESPSTDWEERIDYLMIQQLKTLDEQQRRKYYFEVQKIMSEQLPFIYLITPNTYQGIKKRWNNLEIPPYGSVLWNLDSVWTYEP